MGLEQATVNFSAKIDEDVLILLKALQQDKRTAPSPRDMKEAILMVLHEYVNHDHSNDTPHTSCPRKMNVLCIMEPDTFQSLKRIALERTGKVDVERAITEALRWYIDRKYPRS